jgi:TRAP-type C4-dicarboxylate transport system substrate-binding protein
MMLRKTLLGALGALALMAGVAPSEASAAEVIKIGTLAPKASPWGKVFEVWSKAVSQKSESKLEIQFFYNGTQGDEGAMVGKMKAGQLDGAAITAVGLSKIYKPVLALQLPGALTTWAKVDKAQSALRPEFERGMGDAGFKLLGWGNVGRAHLMSKGYEIRTPDSLKGRKPYMWRDDEISPKLFQAIGGVTPVPLNVPEVLPSLNTGAIDALNTSALAAEQLQWAPKLDTITEDVTGVGIGALVMSSKRLDALPGDLKSILTDTGAVASKALGDKIRAEDDAAFGRLKGKMKVVTWTADEKAKWEALFKKARQTLAQGTFSADMVSKIEGYAQ